jgi:hypothetical protein
MGASPMSAAILIVPLMGLLVLAVIGISPFAIIGGIWTLFFGG